MPFRTKTKPNDRRRKKLNKFDLILLNYAAPYIIIIIIITFSFLYNSTFCFFFVYCCSFLFHLSVNKRQSKNIMLYNLNS